MIHRSLGAWLAGAVGFAALLGAAERAHACRTTTCAVADPPRQCTRDAAGCWSTGRPLYWPGGCLGFLVDHRGLPRLGLGYAETEALVASAFALWTNAECGAEHPSISVQSLGATECLRRDFNLEGPNSNSVIFHASRWPHDPLALGITTVTFDPDSGVLLDTDVEINVTDPHSDYIGIHYVLAHEAGHVFGLDHSRDGSSLMFERTRQGFEARPPRLASDDVTTICSAYPPAESAASCDYVPRDGYSPYCGGDVDASCALASPGARTARFAAAHALLAMLVTAWLVRRRRSRLG